MSIEDDFAEFRRVAGEEIAKLREENASLREALAIESERSLYWRNIAGRKEAQP